MCASSQVSHAQNNTWHLVHPCEVTLQVKQNHASGKQGCAALPTKIPGTLEQLPAPSRPHPHPGPTIACLPLKSITRTGSLEVSFPRTPLELLTYVQVEKSIQHTHQISQRGEDSNGPSPTASAAARPRDDLGWPPHLPSPCSTPSAHCEENHSGSEKSNDSNVQFVNEILTTGLSYLTYYEYIL